MTWNGRIGVRPRPLRSSSSDDYEYKNSAAESEGEQQSLCSFEGTKGVVGCDVVVDGIALGVYSAEEEIVNRHDQFVRCYTYSSFPNALQKFMVESKSGIETSNTETLEKLHSKFLDVVQEILNQGLYSDELERYNISGPFFIRQYASPSVRSPGKGDDDNDDNDTNTPSIMFANYLHNDAWFKSITRENDDPIAMINIWFVLNDNPPDNQLVFYETSAVQTSQTHMLHGRIDDVEGQTVICNQDMCWGKFYCFISGQRNDSGRVLLHGAMDVVTENLAIAFDEDSKRNIIRNHESTQPRRSCEMRYTLHANPTSPRMKDKSEKQTDDDDNDDNHFGRALFDTGIEEDEEEDIG